jgi:hypothetical protein
MEKFNNTVAVPVGLYPGLLNAEEASRSSLLSEE